MTRATYKQYPPTYGRGPVGPPLAANGRALRWTPGPDELRLPSCEDELVPQNTRHAVGHRGWLRRLAGALARAA